jgi:D-arabinose 1-dehydrogenase-like Zn-dependent alcohol dehydrogenase
MRRWQRSLEQTYVDSRATNAAEALQKMGGAQVILATAPSSKAMSDLVDGLGLNGELIVVCCAAGTAADSEDTLRFAELTGVRPMIETYPLEKAAEAYARMLSGNAQFRVVLTM